LKKLLGQVYTINYGDSINPFEPKYNIKFSLGCDLSSDHKYVVELPEAKNIKNEPFICCIRPDGTVVFLKDLTIGSHEDGTSYVSFTI